VERGVASKIVLEMPLATWQYNWENEGEHLGFLIDDVEGTAAVRPDGEHVDLYGYISLAVAAIQSQQAQIEALEAEIKALKTQPTPH